MVKEPRFGRLFSWNASKIEACLTPGDEQRSKQEYTNGEHLFILKNNNQETQRNHSKETSEFESYEI